MVIENNPITTPARHSFYQSRDHHQQRDYWWIAMDHCYSRPWNWRPESTFLRPTKTLFMPKNGKVGSRKSTNPLALQSDHSDDGNGSELDVEIGPDENGPVCDRSKVKLLMEECERHAGLVRVDDGTEDWEEGVSKHNWTPTQSRLFAGIVSILNSDNLARLSIANSPNEAIARRATIDKSVERIRKLMATVSWETKYTLWLHQLLIESLNRPYLAIYLDILQTLRSKLPSFVDKLLTSTNTNRLSLMGYEHLFPLLKRPWDPVALSLMQDKPKKLPGNPVIVIVPSTPISSKRMLKWINLLSSLATVVTIPSNYGGAAGHKLSMINCVDQMFVMTRNKIQDLKVDYPGRNIVLLGFGFGATLALQVAQFEQVLCVVCLGFSLVTAEGRRGEADDNLLELQWPVLFVVGQNSNTSLQEDMEDLRERMRVETGLIVVGSADDNLRVTKKKKKTEGITQSIVDRCIADEIGEFISGVILSPYPPQIRQSPTNLTTDSAKKMKMERKRYNSNTSSVESEPPSPTQHRVTRPGHNNSTKNCIGRPPGSKSKAKWAQGTPSSPPSPSPPSFTTTIDTSISNSVLDSHNYSILSASSNTSTNGPPPKKIKTLKPVPPSATTSTPSSSSSSPVKHSSTASSTPITAMEKVSLGGLQGRTLQNLLQAGNTTVKSSGIKVLENVKITNAIHPKFLTNAGKLIDMSKMSSLTSAKSASSLILLPDGKIKNMGAPKGAGRYITSKKQLLGNKPPKPLKKYSFAPITHYQTTPQQILPPPTNLSTQDIMDLPIIFADDNSEILETSTLTTHELKPPPTHQLPPQYQIQGNKILFCNPTTAANLTKSSSFSIISSNTHPKTTTSTLNLSTTSSAPQSKLTPKYTKIILSSKKSQGEDLRITPASSVGQNLIGRLSSEVTVVKKPLVVHDEFDLEDEIAASTLFKPVADAAEDFDEVEEEMEEEESEEPVDLSEFITESDGDLEIIESSNNELIEGEPPNKIRRLDG